MPTSARDDVGIVPYNILFLQSEHCTVHVQCFFMINDKKLLLKLHR